MVDGEVKNVEKNNGINMTGVMVKTGHKNISPIVYIDEMYENGTSVEKASEMVLKIAEKSKIDDNVDLSYLKDFDKAKLYLRARLLNATTNVEVSRPAGHGFDDLIIVPTIVLGDRIKKDNFSSVKITEGMLKSWGKTADEVIDIAEANSSYDTSRRRIIDVLMEMMGIDEMDEFDIPLYVVSNNSKMYGAYAVIPMLNELREMFPQGFAVIPSSIHEVLVTPLGLPSEDMNTMINDVNEAEVSEAERLSDHAYIFS